MPGDGSLDFQAIVGALAARAIRAGSWSRPNGTDRQSPLEMAKRGIRELLRVMAAAG